MRLRLRPTTIVVTILFIIGGTHCSEENEKSLSTSIAGMEQLLVTERALIENLNSYALELQKKLETIRSGVDGLRIENQKSHLNAEEYLSNPLNGFSLIRRMHEDWINWELYMSEPVGTVQIKEIQKQRGAMPTNNDLVEAVDAIYRLQKSYDLQSSDIATGFLNGKQYDAKLATIDSFTIGKQLFYQEEYYHAGFWLYTALQSYQDSEVHDALKFSKQHIRDFYSEVMLKQDRPKDALSLINQSLKVTPDSAVLLRRKAEVETIAKTFNGPPKAYSLPIPTDHQLGCRGMFSKKFSKLHCRYNTTTTAFLKLAPLKMEEVYLDPYMVLYHDVISDCEIAELKELTNSKLKRATVYSEDISKSIVVNRRTSKFHWLPDGTSNTTIRINQRISDMTGFDLNGSEMLQVMNYGLGGHYATHYDFFNTSEVSIFSSGHYATHYDFFNTSETADVVRMQGDRKSTVLFYLSDVQQGGDTVFPNIKIAVHPIKGSAVIWYNLNNKGEGDWRTMHAACPVIVGSKWVCNKWIRQKQQIFRNPCYKHG